MLTNFKCRKYADFLRKHKRAIGRKSGSYKPSNEVDFIPWLTKEVM